MNVHPPAEGRSSPAMSRSKVVLPAPFGPVTRQRLARADRKIEPGKHRLAAADAGQVRAGQRRAANRVMAAFRGRMQRPHASFSIAKPQ